MNRVTPLQAPQLLRQIEPHLLGADARHQERFSSLLALIAASADGTIIRSALSQALYPGLTADSIKSDLATFKTAISLAADKAGLGKLILVTPKGRGGPNQLLWLEIEAHLQPAVPAGTHLATTYIGQQISVAAHAVDLSPLQVVVSFAGADQKLADALLSGVKTGLKARTSSLASRINFWTFRSAVGEDGTQGGQNDRQIMDQEFKRSAAGLLLVSPSACASSYIQQDEWPLFRNKTGKILKPFVAVLLAPIQQDKHNLGSLGSTKQGATQFLHVHDEGQNYAWDRCQRDPALKRQFEEKLIDQLIQLIETSLPPPLQPKTELTPDNPSQRATAAATKKETAKTRAAQHHAIYDASQDANVPALCKSLGALGAAQERLQAERTQGSPQAAIEEGVEIVPAMVNWACDPGDTPFAVLLGEYGMGKTWNSQLLAQALEQRIKNPTPDSSPTPTPIYLDLRKAIEDKKTLLGGDLPTLEFFLDRLNTRNTPPGQAAPTGKDTLQAVQQEGALLIFDGLDEVLAHNPDEAWGQQFINLLFSALPFSHWPRHLNKDSASKNPGKLLLTCRTHYFKNTQTQNEQILGVGREQHRAAKPRAWQMLPFTKDQVLAYLQRHTPEQDPQVVFDLIASVHNLVEVSSRPQGLKMVCSQISKIEQAKREGTLVNGATLYAWMVQEWLNRDMGKHQLLQEDKAILMQDLALHLWQRGAREIKWDQLAKWFRTWLRLDPVRSATPQYQKAETPLLTDLRNATFLVRPGEDSFSFAHTSILEYFLALRLHRSLEQDDIKVWDDLNPSHETLVFLHQHQLTCDAYTQSQVRNTLCKHLGRANTAGTAARLSLLALFELSPPEWKLATLDISGLNLERHTFVGLQLEILIADGALLAESRWSRCRFKNSSWKQANCRQVQFEHIQGRRADFSGAHLLASRWRKVAIDQLELHGAQTQAMQTVDCTTQGGNSWTGNAKTSLPGKLPSGWRLQWTGHHDTVTGCALSADGQTLLTASGDKTARLWNRQGECLQVLKGHESELSACALSADGQTLLTASGDKTARLWNRQGECLHVLTGHEEMLSACALSADGHTLLTASDDKTARLWNRQGECLQVLTGHEKFITACALSADGQTLLTASGDKTARLWNRQGECLQVLTGHEEMLSACALSADGQTLLTTAYDKTARLWNRQGECLLVLTGHEEMLSTCALSADGQTLLTASHDNTAHLWSRQGECLLVLTGHEKFTTACALSADGQTLLTASHDNTARLWSRQGKCLLVLTEHEYVLNTCALSADRQTLLTTGWDQTARLWNRQGECLQVLTGHEEMLSACALSADGHTLLTASDDKTARLWDRQGECLQVLTGHEEMLSACALSADGHTLLTASHDKTARLWNRQGECLQVLKGHEKKLSACALSADGQTLLTVAYDNTARLWNRQGECLLVLTGHEEMLSACALSADGQTLLTTAYDKTARLWNRQGECLQVLRHESEVNACGLSADGQNAITATGTQIRQWHRGTAAWACTLELHPATQTRIWLDQQTQTLKLDGPDWPYWQLQSSGSTENGPDSAPKYLLGETIAEWGPMAHEQLANADDWRFLPRDDIQVKTGL